MRNTVYKRYANIKKFLDKQYILSAVLEIDEVIPEYIPMVDLKLKKLNKKEMSFGFDTPDQNTKLLSPKKYRDFISYMRIIRQAKHGHILKKGDDKSISYLNCSLDFPIRMSKQGFSLDKHRYYILTVLSPRSYKLRLLVSPDVDKRWLQRLAVHGFSFNRPNLVRFLQLLTDHLVPTIEETDVFSSGHISTDISPVVSITVKKGHLIVHHELSQSKFDLTKFNGSLHSDKSGDVVLYFSPIVPQGVSLSIVLRPEINRNILKTIA